ncbi:MoaD/ThiS family protein [Novosphingobium sp.]|uniref:MoaD/ThiS family protein n=1 Tax=Novosphingobium sp. TaxID=1874826 RepID=UPI00286E6451|nr:MoaD/ThiS family protein [Novosphingobium sp.]
MIKLVFLGRLADLAGGGEIDITIAGPTRLEDLLLCLPGPLAEPLADLRVKLALNGRLVPRESLVVDAGDELAFLPPVSGG